MSSEAHRTLLRIKTHIKEQFQASVFQTRYLFWGYTNFFLEIYIFFTLMKIFLKILHHQNEPFHLCLGSLWGHSSTILIIARQWYINSDRLNAICSSNMQQNDTNCVLHKQVWFKKRNGYMASLQSMWYTSHAELRRTCLLARFLLPVDI
jgi:hypothetical protein